jgi:hypothetical protein
MILSNVYEAGVGVAILAGVLVNTIVFASVLPGTTAKPVAPDCADKTTFEASMPTGLMQGSVNKGSFAQNCIFIDPRVSGEGMVSPRT